MLKKTKRIISLVTELETKTSPGFYFPILNNTLPAVVVRTVVLGVIGAGAGVVVPSIQIFPH